MKPTDPKKASLKPALKTPTKPSRAPSEARPPQSARPAPVANREAVDLSAVDGLVGALTEVRPEAREAFEGQFPDEACDVQGATTRAVDILREAARALRGVEGALQAHPSVRYSTERLRYLADLTLALSHAVSSQIVRRNEGTGYKSLVQRRTDAALSQRDELLGVLTQLSGRNELDLLAQARGDTRTPENLLDSLEALSKLAEGWLARKDLRARVLVETHRLTRADVDAAREAASALREAMEQARKGPTLLHRDLPPTNRIEGRVTLELAVLDEALNLARRKDPSVPSLVLGPVLRRAVRGERPTQKDPEGGKPEGGKPEGGKPTG